MAEEFFENVRIPFIVQKYEDKAIVIPKELYMDFSTGKMYVKSIDGATEIEVGRKTIENTIKVEIEKLIGKSTSNGNTLRKLQNLVEPLKLWKDQMDSIGYLSVSTIAEILDVFKDMEETAPTLFAQLQYKVDKVQGLELSDNDFTNTLFNKLMGIEKEANLYTHPEIQACNYVAPISLVNGRTGDVVITKEELGLGNVQAGAKKYVHPRDKQCAAVSIDSVQIGGDTPKTGIVTLNKASFYLDKVVNNTLITEAEIAATTDGNLPANKYCTPHTFNLYLQKLKALGKFDETQYKYVPKTVNLTINTTPSDATVKVIYDNTIYSGKTHTIKSKTGYVVVVERAGYYKYEKYHYLNSDTDTVINVTLQEGVYDYNFTLNGRITGVSYTLTVKNSSNVVVDTKTILDNRANFASVTVTGKLKPGTYSYTITGSHVGSPTYTPSGSFTIANANVDVNAYTYFRINLEGRFYRNGVQMNTLTQEGEEWRILIYDPGNTQVTAGWRHLPTAPSFETRSAIINKTGYKYAFIPKKYVYNSGGNMVVSSISNAIADKETIIRDIDTSQANCTFIGGQARIKDIIVPADPCSIITHGNTTFGIYNNGQCERPSWLEGLTYTSLYSKLGFTLAANTTGYGPVAINHEGSLHVFKAILDNKPIYINSYAPVVKVCYLDLQTLGLTSPNGKTVSHNGKSFRVKMFTGSDGTWNVGGDMSKIIPILQQISSQFPEISHNNASWWYLSYLNRIGQYGSIVMCRDTVSSYQQNSDGYKYDLMTQRCGAHGMYAMPKVSTIDQTLNSVRPLAADSHNFSLQPGYWFYIEEV